MAEAEQNLAVDPYPYISAELNRILREPDYQRKIKGISELLCFIPEKDQNLSKITKDDFKTLQNLKKQARDIFGTQSRRTSLGPLITNRYGRVIVNREEREKLEKDQEDFEQEADREIAGILLKLIGLVQKRTGKKDNSWFEDTGVGFRPGNTGGKSFNLRQQAEWERRRREREEES